MKKSHSKPIIGIVGGVGAGKSTVAAEFGKLGCGVIRADDLNHEILGQPEVISCLLEWWGGGFLGSDGKLDRGKVADIVFEDGAELKKLTDLLHPLIRRRQEGLIELYQSDPEVKAVVLDVPLLLETGQETSCDVIVFVEALKDKRFGRLKAKRGWTTDRIKKVENLQLGLDIKAKISEYSISNNSGIPATASQVKQILTTILNKRMAGEDIL